MMQDLNANVKSEIPINYFKIVMNTVDGLITNNIEVSSDKVTILNPDFLQSRGWDDLTWISVFGEGEDKRKARFIIWETAQSAGVKPSSINDFYMARGKGEIPYNFTVPAINIRGMAYDTARAVFNVAKRTNTYAFIVEIARSEIGYTDQRPEEFAIVMLAAAIREGFRGPIFIQGDHFQAKAVTSGVPGNGEIDLIKGLIKEAISSGFYNIDIDMSTLVDLDQSDIGRQQEPNIKYSLELDKFIRANEVMGITISIGGEIGHIGGKNSTVEDFTTYMDGLKKDWDPKLACLSKVSVQTGTHHGGVVMSDGSLANVTVDFNVLSNITKVARNQYGMGGAVQHGASTLPDDLFSQFPISETLEIHLATGFQNLIMDHQSFPKELLDAIYLWIDDEKKEERKKNSSDEQFHYQLRKKAWGKFKKECWGIEESIKAEIRSALEEKFEFLFKSLNVFNSKEMLLSKIQLPEVHKKPEDFCKDI